MKSKLKFKNKQMWVPSAALLLSMLLLIGSSASFDVFFSTCPSLGVISAELISFGIPALIVYHMRDKKFPIRLRNQKRRSYYIQYMGFTVQFALTISFLSFLLNLIVYVITGSLEMTLTNVVYGSMVGGKYSLLSFIAIVLIPPVVEELFLRGVIFSAMENVASTKLCIFFSGLCFAMLHANLYNFIGPFMAGCAYAFLSYCYDSIWPAIIAHFLNNLYYYIINHLVTVYSSFGIWHYFTFINLILFLAALYFMLRKLGMELYHKKLLPFTKKGERIRDEVFDIAGNPAFFMFIVSFLLAVILS